MALLLSAGSLSSLPEILLWSSISKCCYLTFSFTIHNKHFKIPCRHDCLCLSVYQCTWRLKLWKWSNMLTSCSVAHSCLVWSKAVVDHCQSQRSVPRQLRAAPANQANLKQPGEWQEGKNSNSSEKHLPLQSSLLLFTLLKPNNEATTPLHTLSHYKFLKNFSHLQTWQHYPRHTDDFLPRGRGLLFLSLPVF